MRYKLFLLLGIAALLLVVYTGDAQAKVYKGSGGYHPPVVVKETKPHPKPLTGIPLWKRTINRRFGYWANHFGRTWNSSTLAIAFRCVSRESGWNPRASNGGTFRGLFQIWYLHAPGRNLYDPISNIECAAQLYGRLGWSPWASTAY